MAVETTPTENTAEYPNNVARMATYMAERQRILLRRKSGEPGPWTSDPILGSNRFCNIFREDDRVTIWIRERIRKPFASHVYLWLMLAIARYINWPPTLDYLITTPGCWPSHDNFSPQNMTKALQDLAAAGKKVYTGAYLIRPESDHSAPWFTWTKHKYIAEITLGRLWEDRKELGHKIFDCKRLEDAVYLLSKEHHYCGWGPFMAYEWVTDLRWTRYLYDARDIYTWANAGPGAIRGLNRLHGRVLNTHPRATKTCEEMRLLMEELNAFTATWFTSMFGGPDKRRFEMRDIEHTLCEFDKYERMRLGQGKMRSKYDWTKAQAL
jgi:hypothetical protein